MIILPMLFQIWPQGVSVCTVFFVTLSCFPAIASSIVSVDKNGGDWSGRSCVLCYILRIGDLRLNCTM